MGERYALHEADYNDYEVPESRENERDDVQDKTEIRKYISLWWYSLMPRELADQAITRSIICQYTMYLT